MIKRVSSLSIMIIIMLSITCYASEGGFKVLSGDGVEFKFSLKNADENGINNPELHSNKDEKSKFIQGTVNRVISGIYNNEGNSYVDMVEQAKGGKEFIEFCKVHFPNMSATIKDLSKEDVAVDTNFVENDSYGILGVAKLTFADNNDFNYADNPVSIIFEKRTGEEWKLTEIQLKDVDTMSVFREMSASTNNTGNNKDTTQKVVSETKVKNTEVIAAKDKSETPYGIIITTGVILAACIVIVGLRIRGIKKQ